jgi:predicted nucleic acid-binding protein
VGASVVRGALLDNSAWARLRPPSIVSASRRTEVARAIEAGEIIVCVPFLLEACYSARNAMEHDELRRELEALPLVHIDEQVEQRALDAQGQLARSGHHRLSPADVLIATMADRFELDVLHYDADFDIIAGKTDLQFGSVWLAKRGSL